MTARTLRRCAGHCPKIGKGPGPCRVLGLVHLGCGPEAARFLYDKDY
jgi:hypothetical protein